VKYSYLGVVKPLDRLQAGCLCRAINNNELEILEGLRQNGGNALLDEGAVE
jgi:hypothetical protein